MGDSYPIQACSVKLGFSQVEGIIPLSLAIFHVHYNNRHTDILASDYISPSPENAGGILDNYGGLIDCLILT